MKTTVANNSFSWSLALFLLLAIFPLQLAAQDAPHQVAGITLGTHIDDYPNIIRTNFLKEVVITDQYGFRKGVISYGACLHKNLILKIDMKYKDKSKSFYQKLLKEFKQRFGEPDSWHGDSFGVLYLWKWSFIDKDQNRISLSLQYNGKNSNETIGNMVKLSLPEKIEEERLCFVRMCGEISKEHDTEDSAEGEDVDWSYLIPR
ncbi:MAG: hypothetical protein ACWGOX_16145 [Desulforhopalus sp.]